MSDEPQKEWVCDDASRARTAAALAELDAVHANYPECAVCGQRCMRLDKYATCSKVSETHRQHRNEFRAGERR